MSVLSPTTSVGRPVHLCGRALGRARHVCAFVSSDEEAHAILTPFVKEGLERGEKVLQIVDPAHRDAHVSCLRDAGADPERALAEGRLDLMGWDDAYLKDGRFDADRMLATLEAYLEGRRASGFPLARCMGGMEWALASAPGTEDLLEYETRVNLLSPRHEDPLVCTYDLTRFPAGTVIDVMRTHPVVILGGMIHENPFFVEPREMLRELAARKGRNA